MMINQYVPKNSRCLRPATIRCAILALWAAGGFSLAQAQQSAQPAFPSATAAAQGLFQAVQTNNEQTIASILGGPTELTSSRDPGQDKADRELFVEKYQEMHRLSRESDGSVTLYIGAENWPFPVPLVDENGTWRFDPEAGKKEVLFRRIGENELIAIAKCREFAPAEEHYTAVPGDPTSGSANGDPVLVNGYYFRLAPVQSGSSRTPAAIALIAYPAEYRSSGVMTFVVLNNGAVYEKDLGSDTAKLASTMATFHKDPTWRPSGE